MFDRELLKGSTSLLILQLLGDRPMYGYEIAKVMEQRSDHTLRVREGTLYPALHKLEQQGYIDSYWEQQKKGKPRKYYRLTTEGVKMLEAKTKEWTLFSNMMDRMLGKEQ
ncbi:PadR family transcriptional regulator [Siminovitchia sp. FSL H7-0308]|uniref:PadR family transcriptional regulator PadR n=1 Tax=Siminovitchia thermophila TaxID=1245522 RepID=A0ABS2R2Q2_9BACI|nr:PadR family transcriptional regulator [Siminovitchia thermophila]MBM7713916.1 PadR family transcriptional regulator PadR [Siminovitchia thermophila]ONK22459.1 PadR family transcriptional regulator [Bacillus sp. VT-16-64]